MSDKKNSFENTENDLNKDEIAPISTEEPIVNTEVKTDIVPTVAPNSIEKDDDTKNSAIAEENTKQEESLKTIDSIVASDTSFAVTDSGEILIDNTSDSIQAEPPVQELDRTPKLKEPLSKKKKITIIVSSVAALVIIFCAIFFPCFFFFKGKIMVGNAEDFANPESGKYFVLKKDVTVDGDLDLSNSTCSIDLNGHNLTVKGTLTLSTEEDCSINIGTKDKDNYKASGLLIVDSIVVNTPNANISFATSTVVKDKVSVQSAKSVLITAMTIVNSGTFAADDILVRDAIITSNDNTTLAFKNCFKLTINGQITAKTIALEGPTNAVFNSNSYVNNLLLDTATTAQVYGRVASITGGEKVAMLQGHSCEAYDGVALLAIYRAYNDEFSASNCGKIVYIEKLDTPVDLIVNERNGMFLATCAQIEGFSDIRYAFEIAGKTFGPNEYNFCDISYVLKSSGASTHTISAYVIGNFDFDKLTNLTAGPDGNVLYLDSDKKTITYTYTLQLDTPINLAITEEDDSVMLSYDIVDFADFYTIYVDGSSCGTTKETSFDITSYVTKLGYHSIRVTANSDSKELTTSKESMISWKHTQQLADVENLTATYTTQGNGDETIYVTTITFDAVENAKVYVLDIDGQIIRISNGTSYTYTSQNSAPLSIKVIAEQYEYYLSSNGKTVNPTAA